MPSITPAPAEAAAPTSQKLGAAPNLLDLVPAKVAVSSTVANPHDFPELLVDGKLDTAWNGKTGDLVGGFLAFRVPADAHVDHIEMTAGYDRIKGDVDLFTANHRITKVQLSRGGVVLGERSLDPNVRGLQVLAVDGPGGDYEIKVLATLPGTRKEWRELTVSELRVVGTPGAARRDRAAPLRVSVGSLDQAPDALPDDPPVVTTAAHANVAALCAAYVKSVAARKAELEESAQMNQLKLRAANCAESPRALRFVGDATYRRAFYVELSDGIRTELRLVVEVPRGLALTTIGWATRDPLDPGCPSIPSIQEVESLRVENGHLVAVLRGTVGAYDAAGNYAPAKTLDATWCTEGGGKLACRTYGAQYRPPLAHFAITPGGELVRQ